MPFQTLFRNRISQLLLGAVLITLAGGCANYHLGRQAPLPFSRLYIAPVENVSFAPQAQAPLHRELSEQFLTSGSVKLVSSEADADAVLRVAITEFDRDVAVTQENDTGLARGFSVVMTAKSELINARTSKPYFRDRVTTARIMTFVDGGEQPAEYQAMPALTRDLALKIKDTVLSTW